MLASYQRGLGKTCDLHTELISKNLQGDWVQLNDLHRSTSLRSCYHELTISGSGQVRHLSKFTWRTTKLGTTQHVGQTGSRGLSFVSIQCDKRYKTIYYNCYNILPKLTSSPVFLSVYTCFLIQTEIFLQILIVKI